MRIFKTWLGVQAEITCEDCCIELSIHPDLRRPFTQADADDRETVACTYCGREVKKEDLPDGP